jgi:hypothetical protein
LFWIVWAMGIILIPYEFYDCVFLVL